MNKDKRRKKKRKAHQVKKIGNYNEKIEKRLKGKDNRESERWKRKAIDERTMKKEALKERESKKAE